jgi:DNA repair exonuclease SbcCD ATPase subunit
MNFFVQFELDGEFREIIRSRHRDVFSYENFSEGEKTRIDLSLMFAWRAVAKLKNSVSTNLLILDEVLDGSLDNSGIDDIMKLINSFRNETNIFVISHKDLFVDKFDSIIKFEKVGNFSRVV